MQKLNVAMIGGGFMGKAHAMAYASMPMFFWPAPAIPVRKVVVDVNQEMAETARDRFGFEEASSDWRAVIARPDIDIVDICTPNNSHAEIAIAAAQAGKHIICEKPLARTGAESRTMLDAVNASGSIHMVAFNYRRTPAVALAKKLIEEGRIGDILNFRGTYLQDWSADPDAPLSWRFQKSIAGSGTVGDIGTHVVDLARYLVGEIGAVNAMVHNYIPTRPLQSGGVDKLGAAQKQAAGPRGTVDVDDEMLTMMRFK
ncbi:MAG: dehydrogenase, partial [Devosia sp.]|nr:dehydrogenase [Devosia sp.]